MVAFSFANGGAMGAPGQIIVVNKEAKVFVMNYAYGDMEIEMCDEVCPPLKHCVFGYFGVDVAPVGWKGMYLDGGNFLVLKESLYHQLEEEMFKIQPYELYGE